MRIGEIILRALCRDVAEDDYCQTLEHATSGNELSLLRRAYPNLSSIVGGKRVVDFGCGEGRQALALHKEEKCYVTGLDTNADTLLKAKHLALDAGIDEESLQFLDVASEDQEGKFDVVISQNAMEHFPDPVEVIRQMKRLIHDNGKILITFGPPWYAPYGSHMHFFCKVPWINILFSEETIMHVRSFYRDDGAERFVDVESGLNKMSLKKFTNIISESDLNIESIKYKAVKGQDWIAKIPLIKELFVNHVTCVLSPIKNRN